MNKKAQIKLLEGMTDDAKNKYRRNEDLEIKNRELKLLKEQNDLIKEQMASQRKYLKKQLCWNKWLVIWTICLSAISIGSTIILTCIQIK